MGNRSRRPFGATLVALIVLGAIGENSAHGQAEPARVADAPPASSLTLGEAIGRALADNPGLRAAGLDVDIARARRDASALPTPLSIGVEVENFGGSDSLGGFDATETTLQLSKAFERGGKRALRAGLGDARVSLAESERRRARLDLAAEVTRRFVRVLVAQARIELAGEAIDIAAETREIVARRVEVGRSSEAELATAEIALAQAELERAGLDSRLESDRVGLATLWGETRADFGSARAELSALPAVEPFEGLRRRIDANPDLVRLVGETRIAEAEQRLAEARRQADLSVGFGLKHLAVPDDTGFTVSVSMPLGSRTRAAPSVAAAAARHERLPEVLEERRLELVAVLFELHEALETARERYRTLAMSLVPRGERAVELYRQGFELGSYSLLELSAAQRELLALRRRALTAAADFHLTLAEIEQLLGGVDWPGEAP